VRRRRQNVVEINNTVVDLFESRIDVFDVRLRLDYFVAHQVHHDFGHPTRLPVAWALEYHVLHLAAAQVFYALFTQHPRDRVGDVALTAAIRADDGSDSVSSEDDFGVVGEGFEAGDF